MHRTLLGLLLLGAGIFLALVPLSRGAEEPSDVSRSFTITTDPAVTSLSVTYIDRMTGGREIFSLYGDGRLSHELRQRTGTVVKSASVQLDYDTARSMVDLVVSRGVLDTTQRALQEEMQAQSRPGRSMWRVSDGADMLVTIAVTSYSRNGEDLGPTEATLRVHAPQEMARTFPGIAVLKGLGDLTDALLLRAKTMHSPEGS